MQTSQMRASERTIMSDAFDARKQRILARSDLFAGLSEPVRVEVMRHSTIVRVERRRSLTRPQDRALFLIGSGRVRVIRRVEGREITLGYRGAGELLGEESLFEPDLPIETLVHEQVEALRVPLTIVRRLMETHPAFAIQLTGLVGQRCLKAEARVQALLTRSVESRVAQFVLEAADRHGIPDSRGMLIGVKFTHQEMASYVGSTRETVTLILGELKRAGLIETDHRRIVVTDAQGLRARV